MRVAGRLRVVVDPRAAAVERPHHTSQFDPDDERVRVGRVQGDRADVVRPRTRGKDQRGSLGSRRSSGSSCQVFPPVLGAVKIARLGSRVDHGHAVVRVRGRHAHRHHPTVRDAVPRRAPVFASVVGRVQASSSVATYTRSGSFGSIATRRGAATVSTVWASAHACPSGSTGRPRRRSRRTRARAQTCARRAFCARSYAIRNRSSALSASSGEWIDTVESSPSRATRDGAEPYPRQSVRRARGAGTADRRSGRRGDARARAGRPGTRRRRTGAAPRRPPARSALCPRFVHQ